jgi:Tfp pilus assembly protein PilP
MFFGYNRFIFAQDDDFNFDDSFLNDDTTLTTDDDIPVADDGTTDSDSAKSSNFDMSNAEIEKFMISPKLRVKYFNDDPADDKNHKDPFKVLIVKKVMFARPKNIVSETKIEEKVIPPLNLKLVGIIQAGDRKMAMITLDDKYMELFEGDQDPQGQFKVKQINDDSVLIISYRRNGELRTLTLGGK